MLEFSLIYNLSSVVIGCVIFLGVALFLRHRKNLPPGPRGVPLLGVLPTLATMDPDGTRRWLSSLARKYDIYSMNVAGQLVVVLTQYTTMKSAFVNADAVDRPPLVMFKGILSDPQATGIFLSSGEKWKELRMHTLGFLNGSGTSKTTFEEVIVNEIKKLTKEIRHLKGQAFNLHDILRGAVVDIVCRVTFGKTFTESNVRYRKFIDSINRLSDIRGLGSIQAMIPKIQRLKFLSGVHEARPLLVNIVEFIGQEVEEHHKTLDSDNPNDYTDVLLRAMKLKKSNNQDTNIDYNSTVLSILDIFLGGIESVVSTLRWAILYMAAHSEIQQRVQDEIEAKVGSDVTPTSLDQSNLPFTSATLCEAQRLGCVVPFIGPHCVSKDTTLFGFNIPKDTVIIGDFWNTTRDLMVWEESGDPELFVPDRFLDDQGHFNPRSQQLNVFSRGRRLCAGESLAKMELFLFFSHLLQNFTFAFPETAHQVSYKGELRMTFSPKPFKIIAASKRNSQVDN